MTALLTPWRLAMSITWLHISAPSRAHKTSAPLARALIGKTVGDNVEVTTPAGSKSYEVVKVQFR